MKKLTWDQLKVAVAKEYDVVVTDKNLILEDEDRVKLHLPGEVITVAKDIRNIEQGANIGYILV